MTGPEHYARAEQLLTDAADILRPHDEGHCEADRLIAEAQAHATLALAAATALLPGDPDSASRGAWVSVIHELEGGR
ncbi:hypothetical protein [Streptomyces sp. BRB081]|uniref:hypothetical protein n=1 Tax=Streptomyces sp. BRB081 TaxID=2769544 RepID=UPI0018ACDA29|nr:hypothetical protein [Streptomyces sp. BRB081]MBL3808469.1 hypothetical protein [Streptomyces sp. BRB081]MBL3808554.1 hypothetical protein [Streptomyces sp. BRB081]